MLNIEKKANGSELTVALIGRLDTTTAPELEQAIQAYGLPVQRIPVLRFSLPLTAWREGML